MYTVNVMHHVALILKERPYVIMHLQFSGMRTGEQ